MSGTTTPTTADTKSVASIRSKSYQTTKNYQPKR